jgi:hypothetical protein
VRHLCFECVTTTMVMHKVYIVWCLQVFLYLSPVRSRPFPVVTSIFGGRAVGVLFCGREVFIWWLGVCLFPASGWVAGSGGGRWVPVSGAAAGAWGGPIFCSFTILTLFWEVVFYSLHRRGNLWAWSEGQMDTQPLSPSDHFCAPLNETELNRWRRKPPQPPQPPQPPRPHPYPRRSAISSTTY